MCYVFLHTGSKVLKKRDRPRGKGCQPLRRFKTRVLRPFTFLCSHDIPKPALTCFIPMHSYWPLHTWSYMYHVILIPECQCYTMFFPWKQVKTCPFFVSSPAFFFCGLPCRWASQELYTDSDNLGPTSSINASYPAQEKGSDLPILLSGTKCKGRSRFQQQCKTWLNNKRISLHFDICIFHYLSWFDVVNSHLIFLSMS